MKGFPLLLVLLLVLGCSPTPRPQKPTVLVSVLPQAWFVERIGGKGVDVEVMIPPGANPATYEPTMRQMQAVSRASVYVTVGHPGFPFEKTWLGPILRQGPKLRIVDGSAGAKRLEGDPHVWVAPSSVRVMARNIADALVELQPEREEEIRANLQAALEEVDAADRNLRQALQGHRGERFFVFHPTWGYLAEEYGLEQVAVEHAGREPSAGELSGLIERARREKVKVIFVQPQFPKESAEILARDLGARVVSLDPLARNWPETLRQVAEAFREAL